MLDDENIDELSDKWRELLQDKDGDGALELYCKRLIPCMLPGLRKLFRETYNRDANYDGLISLQGFSPDTVILAYQFVQPKTIVVLYTEETKHLLDTVVRLAHIPQYKFFHEPFREVPPDDIYRALDAALKRFPKDARIAIELTGGKNVMGGALAIASGMLDIDLLYIDYHEYMPQFRKPKPKSTYIHLVGNPTKLSTDLFGSLEIRQAVEFFNLGKYDNSKALFEDLGRRMVNPRAVEFGAKLSEFYLQWDSFAFEDAYEHVEALCQQKNLFQDQILSLFSINFKQLERQFDGIKELADAARQSIMWNFYFGALRHEKNGLYDLAALLYYRTLEDILDNALKDIASDFDRSKPDYSLFEIGSEELTSKFKNFRASTNQRKTVSLNDEHLPNTIAMFEAFCLLGALNSPLVKKFKAPKIMNVAQIRNFSVYAHGLRPMNKKLLSDIRQLATDMILVYAEIKGFSSIEAQSDKFSFMELTMREKSEYSSE